jgi:transcription antitermination factor NusG
MKPTQTANVVGVRPGADERRYADFPGFSALQSAGSAGRVACLYTRPRHEKSIARTCEDGGIAHYVPLRTVTHRYASGSKVRDLPLFSGYLFAFATPDQEYYLRRQRNLLGFIPVHDPTRLLAELGEVHKALCAAAQLQTLPHLVTGKPVEIRRGPFRGVTGVIAEVRRNFRVALNVNFIGRAVLLEVNAEDVEAV